MTQRANYNVLSHDSVKHMFALEKSFETATLGKSLLSLVKLRVSQINGCVFCVDMHTKEAVKVGERELRLHHVVVWRESTLFEPRERAALAWAELLTRISHHEVSDADFAKISAHFSEKEVSDLTVAIAAINAWNRLGIAFRSTPGSLDKAMGLDKIYV